MPFGARNDNRFDTQGLTGPSGYPATSSTVSVNTVDGLVTFSGGAIVTNIVNLPADTSSLYETANFAGATYQNPLTITFANPITNFFLDVYNGNPTDVEYTVADNAGHSSTSPKTRYISDRALLGRTGENTFQDRCLKPLGHPS
jgi:hypothetical protein